MVRFNPMFTEKIKFIVYFVVSRLIIAKMLLECEKLAGLQVSSDRNIYNNRRFVVPFEKENNLYQFDIHADTFVSSKYAVTANNLDEGLSPVSLELPDIYPMTCNVSITKENIYNIEKMYRKCCF